MQRIVKHLVSLAVSTLLGGVCVAACASEEPTYDANLAAIGCLDCGEETGGCCLVEHRRCGQKDPATQQCRPKEGDCIPTFCPNLGGTPCCTQGTNVCGVDNGMGCNAPSVPDAG